MRTPARSKLGGWGCCI